MADRIVVDRIEEDRAVLEIGDELIEVPASALPEGAAEGSVLSLAVQPAEDIQSAAEARLERLRNRSPEPDGPIQL